MSVATVPTVYGIETIAKKDAIMIFTITVATVPTVHGIETRRPSAVVLVSVDMLQQYLPFTVLKHIDFSQASEIKVVGCCSSAYCLRYAQQSTIN